jgi:hypothetical protein
MPTRRFPIKPRRRGARSTSLSTDTPLHVALRAIEIERDNLSRAESLLGCLTVAMEKGEMSHKGPYYPDVAEMARQILRKSINALDPIYLPDPSRNKIKEEFLAGDPASLLVALRVPLLRRQSCMLPHRCSLRIHRRDYSRGSERSASSRSSASANIPG